MSQQDLAVRAGVAIGTVRAVESGRVVEPGFFTVLALADVLGLDAAAASGPSSVEVDQGTDLGGGKDDEFAARRGTEETGR
jgi:transcriptional regulator with XRE-family HTH domain